MNAFDCGTFSLSLEHIRRQVLCIREGVRDESHAGTWVPRKWIRSLSLLRRVGSISPQLPLCVSGVPQELYLYVYIRAAVKKTFLSLSPFSRVEITPPRCDKFSIYCRCARDCCWKSVSKEKGDLAFFRVDGGEAVIIVCGMR